MNLYCDERRDIQWNIAWVQGNPEGKAQGISWGLRLYFIVYPDSSQNTDIFNYNSSIFLPGDQYGKSWFSVLLQQLGTTGKLLPSILSNTGRLNFNIIIFSNWEWFVHFKAETQSNADSFEDVLAKQAGGGCLRDIIQAAEVQSLFCWLALTANYTKLSSWVASKPQGSVKDNVLIIKEAPKIFKDLNSHFFGRQKKKWMIVNERELKLKKVDWSLWKFMKRDESGWKRMKVDEVGWKWMNVDESGWQWMTVFRRVLIFIFFLGGGGR